MSNSNLKAVILAGGNEQIDGQLLLLRPLGAHTIIDYVVQNALKFVSADNLYIVVSAQDDSIQSHLGDGYQYVIQPEQLGTGHAVMQLRPHLADFDGDLLILYGDTALFRPATVRGLVNRHQLRDAKLTLLSAKIAQDLPYGRIVRDGNDQIMDIIEASDASPQVREIRELNVGAYIVEAPLIFETLAAISPVNGKVRLTDCAHRLIRAGAQVESYQIYDEDEALGINTAADLEQAEFVLQKRFYRPKRNEEENRVTFGTGGWRAVIGEGFTMYNVRRLTQALANEIIRRGQETKGVVIGYDRRFLADKAAEAAAEVFAGNNIRAILLMEDAPTPLINYATEIDDCAYGLAFTASHNPPEWNGLKVFHSDGSLLLSHETKQLSDETNRLTLDNVVKLELDIALEAGIVTYKDFTNEYVDAVEALIDLKAIRNASLRVIVDPMYGVGQLTLGIILNEARCRVTFIHERRNPLFGGRSPAPDQEALQQLMTHVREDGYDLGLATDGDADRIAIVDERGEYVSVNDVLLLLYWYMHEVREERGGVVRNLATTHLLDRMAKHLGETCHEAPVGFKHIAAAMVEHDLLLGGESSGGLTIRGHILGKDGIFASALIVEMLAKTGKTISELQAHVWEITGRLYAVEANIPATSEMRAAVPKRLQAALDQNASPYPIVRMSDMDGTKLYFENDNWALLRFSGTEPVLRIFAEADSEEKAAELVDWLKNYVQVG